MSAALPASTSIPLRPVRRPGVARLVVLLGGAALALAGGLGCVLSPAKSCGRQADCDGDSTCDVKLHVCVVDEEGTQCAPSCESHQKCVRGECLARFTGVVLEEPLPGGVVGTGGARLVASLPTVEGRTPRYPEQLVVEVTSESGVAVDRLPLTLREDGKFEGVWLGVSTEGTYLLTAKYEAAGLVGEPVPVVVDRQAPAFAVSYEPPARPVVAGAVLNDAEAAYAQAYRRDETVAVKVATTEVHLDEGAVNLFVRGVGAGGAAGATFGPVPVGEWKDCAEGRCGVAKVPLWRPQLQAFRGEFGLEVKGKDKGGNEGSAAASVKVTRWKWKRSAPASQLIRASPAIGPDGTVYFGTTGAGSVFAVSAEGMQRWEAAVGTVLSSPAVGATGNVYVVAKNAANEAVVSRLAPDTGSGEEWCKVTAADAAEASPALAKTKLASDAVAKETVFAAVKKSAAKGVFLASRGPGDCLSKNGAGTTNHNYDVDFPAMVVHRDGNLYLPDASGILQSLSVGPTELTTRMGWPVGISLFVRGVALFDSALIGSGGGGPGKGGVFSVPESGSSISWQYPPVAAPASPAWPPAVGADGFVTFGDESPKLYRVKHKDNAQLKSVDTKGILKSSPLWGEGGGLYTASFSGTVQMWNAQLELQWELEGLGAIEASPTIDCARASGVAVPGAPGILYVAGNGTNGNLYAFVVDSRGLDTRAPWPKYQHDPRNTGSADTSLAEFACP